MTRSGRSDVTVCVEANALEADLGEPDLAERGVASDCPRALDATYQFDAVPHRTVV